MPEPGVAMKISTLWEERKVIFTPMEHGLRASGIAEFAVREAPPRYALAERLKRSALALIPGLKDAGSRQWVGSRKVGYHLVGQVVASNFFMEPTKNHMSDTHFALSWWNLRWEN